ncbi:hypothetical protein [Thermomonospora cellulosilytica]|uniref:Uncharacterized protein n=1 Tax=Thermomonospora cellulosilytica TaxID=1411118 RepID=A0A7W3N1S2_9ACTN|nr:hypothetical protein [Thermomonospora cellulosilytica]MBA9005887.1 hypothetical protein [Thermomonospora cellulosilytica]
MHAALDALCARTTPAAPPARLLELADRLEALAERALQEEDVTAALAELTGGIGDAHRAAWWAELLACLDNRRRQEDGVLERPGEHEADWSARVDEALAELLGDDRLRRRST